MANFEGDNTDNAWTGDGTDEVANGYAGSDTLDGEFGNDTLNGGSGNDSLLGGEGDDSIDGGGGADQIFGGGGHDAISIDGSDTVDAGDGNDTVTGWNASNSVEGGLGADELRFTTYFDAAQRVTNLVANGGDGDDLILLVKAVLGADAYWNVLHGGAGDDTLALVGSQSSAFGDDGNDTINGSDDWNTFDNLLDGGNGNDVIYGGLHSTAQGGAGNDTLTGSVYGAASVDGGEGHDRLDAGGGFEFDQDFLIFDVVTLRGGAGDDTLRIYRHNGESLGMKDDVVIENPGEGNDTVIVDFDYTLALANVENITGLAASGTLSIAGNGFDNRVHGDNTGTASFSLAGMDGNDTVSGSTGNDTLDGGSGADELWAGGGDDSAQGGNGRDSVGGAAGNDTLSGGNGNDELYGGNGNDSLSGDAGADFLWGDAGVDRLAGGWGADTLTGGADIDTFVFNVAPGSGGSDTVTDFVSGTDKLEISRAAFKLNGTGNTLWAERLTLGTSASETNDRFVFDGTTGNLYYDADGSNAGAQVLFVTLAGVTSITAGDFTLV